MTDGIRLRKHVFSPEPIHVRSSNYFHHKFSKDDKNGILYIKRSNFNDGRLHQNMKVWRIILYFIVHKKSLVVLIAKVVWMYCFMQTAIYLAVLQSHWIRCSMGGFVDAAWGDSFRKVVCCAHLFCTNIELYEATHVSGYSGASLFLENLRSDFTRPANHVPRTFVPIEVSARSINSVDNARRPIRVFIHYALFLSH